MGRRKDLVGERFDNLVVIKALYSDRAGVHWECKCDCGNTKITTTSRLLSGATKSCGCLKENVGDKIRIDITGKRFGKLVATKYNKETGKWLCKCDCGNEKEIASGSLRDGRTTSCGCTHKEMIHDIKFDDISGIQFGELTAIEYFRNNGRTYWKCKCSCGKEIIVERSKLVRGQRSCGCLDISHRGSKGELEVLDFIKSIKPDAKIIQHDRTILNGKEIDILVFYK